MTTGKRIKALRLKKGLSQEKLGELIGVKKAAINKYENGTVINLKQSTIKKLADVFGVSPTYILGMDELPTDKISDEQIKYFLFGSHDIDDDMLQEVRRFAQYLQDKH